MRQELFRMERVTYKEKEMLMLEDFNLQIFQGEIMGMLPVNAYGLASFLKLLRNNLPLYDGYIYYGGEIINSWKGAKRTANRISVIGAQSCLVESLSVSDNIFVLRQGFHQEIIRGRLLKKQLAPFFEDIGVEIPIDAAVGDLSAFERMLVELLRAVTMGHRLIVLNEIGTVISYEELEKFHEILRHYTQKGFTFLYICLHHEEITRVCGRTALFSNGRIQKIIREEEQDAETMRLYTAEYDRMVRSHLESRIKNAPESRELLAFRNISGKNMANLSFSIFEGECLVIQTLENAIFHELKDLLTGDFYPESGEFLLYGRQVDISRSSSIAVIQELPTRTMIFPGLSYMENLCMSLSNRIPSIWMNRRIRSSIRQEYAPILGEDVFYEPVESLNEMQKYRLIYMRILLQKPKLVFCIQPFKGADLPHRMVVWELMEMLLNHGIAVVILSLNLADSLSLADRLLVLERNGKKQEIHRKDFASIPTVAPWLHLYREQMGEAHNEELKKNL